MTDTPRLLAAWEASIPLPPVQRALALLAARRADTDAAALPVGIRERCLLELRAAVLGDALACESDCPACGEAVEFTLSASALLVCTDGAPHHLERDGWRVAFRLPNSRDVAAALASDDPEQTLLAACVLEAERQGAARHPSDLPPDLVAAIEAELDAAAPLACPRLDLACPACGHAWQAEWDIAAHVWRELRGWAEDLLDEAARLSLAYRLPVDEALRLSPWRRRFLLERVA